MGNTPPQEIYNTLVKILIEAMTDSEMKYRINMSLEAHSILSEQPFLAKVRAIQGSHNEGEVSCIITIREDTTMLIIESVSRYPSYGRYMYAWYPRSKHRKNINNLYGELDFRLKNADKPLLDKILSPGEKIIKTFFPIKHEGEKLKCTITDTRILLSRSSFFLNEIGHRSINSISLDREKKEYDIATKIILIVGIVLIIIATITLIRALLDPSGFFPGIELSIVLYALGLPLFSVLIKSYNDFLIIQTGGKSYHFATIERVLLELKNILDDVIIR
ncbi:MAG: hypothetical protein HWN66_07505 [Candidatus Helarchaeota archaeon]|nr:hypothetical protein [Candidatus Helarchaeota archaeon]